MKVFLFILITVLLVGIAFAGIAVKVLFKKHGTFAGSCSSNNPFTRKEGGQCGLCGSKPEEKCRKE